jgi:hypothetical protein
MMRIVTAAVKHLLPAATLLVVLFVLTPQEAQAQGAFGGMAGNWNGGGTITLQNGSRERIRCRATYAIGEAGNGMNQNLRCASDSYQFTLVSAVTYKGGAVSGTWTETTRGVSGAVEGRGAPGRFQVQVNGPGFSANLSLTSSGNSQTIQITSESEMRNVTINLTRGS